MDRNLIPGALALLLVPATVATMLGLMPDKIPSILAYPRPAHRLAVAVDAALRADGLPVKRGKFSFGQDLRHLKPDNTFATMGELRVPPDYPGLWLPFAGTSSLPSLVNLREFNFEGKTRDGRDFRVTIRPDRIGEGSLADFHGDSGLARSLAARISEGLAHPAHPHESAEDRAALIAFFGPRPALKNRTRPGPTTAPPAALTPEQVIYETAPQ